MISGWKLIQDSSNPQRIHRNSKESHQIRWFQDDNWSRVLQNPQRIHNNPKESLKILKNPIKSGDFRMKIEDTKTGILQNPQRIYKTPQRILKNPEEFQITVEDWRIFQLKNGSRILSKSQESTIILKKSQRMEVISSLNWLNMAISWFYFSI